MDFSKCETLLLCKRNALDIHDDLLNDIIAFVFHLNSFKAEFQQLTNK